MTTKQIFLCEKLLTADSSAIVSLKIYGAYANLKQPPSPAEAYVLYGWPHIFDEFSVLMQVNRTFDFMKLNFNVKF